MSDGTTSAAPARKPRQPPGKSTGAGRKAPGRSNLPTEDVLHKERQALELRRARVPYGDIARQLGYASASGAWEAVHRALGRVSQGHAEQYRREEVDMLDRLHRAHWTAALAGDVPAAKLVLSVSERRARLLGLDAAVAIKAQISSELDSEIEQLLRELGASEATPSGT